MDSVAVRGIATELRTSGSVLAECGKQVAAVEFGSGHAGRNYAALGSSVHDGFARIGRALAAFGAGSTRDGDALAANVAANESTDVSTGDELDSQAVS